MKFGLFKADQSVVMPPFLVDVFALLNLVIRIFKLKFKESLNMVTPAMKLAGKIPDVHVQLWASSLLKGNFNYKSCFAINSY